MSTLLVMCSYECLFLDAVCYINLMLIFLQEYKNLDFLEPLIDEMTDQNWVTRCSSDHALERFNAIISEQSWYSLRWRLKKRESGKVTHFFQDVGSISRETAFLARSVIGENIIYRPQPIQSNYRDNQRRNQGR